MSDQQPPARAEAPDGAPEGEVAAAGPPPRSGRGRKTVGDMVRSLAVVLVLVFVVVALNARDDGGETLRPLDFSGALAQARSSAPYDVLAPIGLPGSWVPTSARTGRDGDAVTWHLGYVTRAGDYAGVEQGDGDPGSVVAAVADGATPDGTATISGLRWRRLDGGRPEKRALVLDGEAVTTVVAGGASWAELTALARSLQAGPVPG
ncbi:MAG: DUF4245 domain-containing protein [Sporichthyaceae bacterium]